MQRIIFFFTILLTLQAAQAANTPCSGRKGGVSHCNGQTFICNDGSASRSKKMCDAGDYGPPAKRSKNRK